MKIVFVNPNFSDQRAFDAMEPLAFGILKRLTPPGIELRFYDDRIEEVPVDADADLMAISVQSFTARRAYWIADAYRAAGVPVAMGGVHPSILPEEAAGHSDSVCVGPAEGIWPKLVEDALSGSLKSRYDADPSLDARPIGADRSIFRGKRYKPLKPVQFARGCAYSCDFCSVNLLSGGKVLTRDPADVAAEVAGLDGRYFLLCDDNIASSGPAFRDFLRLVAPLGKKWACQASVDLAADPELLRDMARSGCAAVFIGFESMDRAALSRMGKRAKGEGEYAEAVRAIKREGMMAMGSFVFGYGPDDALAVEEALAFGIREKLCLAQFNIAFPTPGTRLYRRLEAEKRLLFDSWWTDERARYDSCFFRPDGIDPGELELKVNDAKERFNAYSSMLRRSLDPRANAKNPDNLILFWLSNLVSRKEIKRKIRMALG
jgi:radical SAM superfamily enzyme YgiQ (UPF0313 family)